MTLGTPLPPWYNMRATDKDGNMSAEFYLYNDQTFQVLDTTITQYGVNVPTLTNDDVAAFPSGIALGTIWYNSDMDMLQFTGKTGIQTINSHY